MYPSGTSDIPIYLDETAAQTAAAQAGSQGAGSTAPAPHKILTPNGLTSSFAQTSHPSALRVVFPTSLDKQAVDGPWHVTGDIDGDGNLDLISSSLIFFGSGIGNMRLERVIDGVGNYVRVNYSTPSDSPATYQTDVRCSGSNWPETCLKRIPGLVRSYDQGFISSTSQGGGGVTGTENPERTYEFSYLNARMSAAGQGWLGFDRRTVSTSSGGKLHSTVTTDYAPVQRFTPQGVATATTTWPYLYPLASLPKTVTVDSAPAQSLEDAPYARRVQTINDWTVQMSSAGRPFPVTTGRRTAVYDRQMPDNPLTAPPAFDDNGQYLFDCEDSLVTDGYANLRHADRECHQDPDALVVEETVTDTSFVEDPSSWLISNPDTIEVQSYRFPTTARQTKSWSLGYDASGLLHTATRVGDITQHRDITYDRDDFGNVLTVTDTVSGESPRVTHIGYDAENIYPLSVTDALGHTSQVRFDPRWGTPKSVADPNGITVQHHYDAFGRLDQSVDPTGTTVYTYSAPTSLDFTTAVGTIHPRIAINVDREGSNGTRTGSVEREYDYAGRPVSSRVEGLGGALVFQEQAYDLLGRPLGATLPHGADVSAVPTITNTFDDRDRLTRVDHSDGSSAFHYFASFATLSDSDRKWLAVTGCGVVAPNNVCPVGIRLDVDETERRNVTLTDHRGLPSASIDGNNINTATTDHYATFRYGPFNRLVYSAQKRDSGSVLTTTDFDTYGRALSQTDPDTGTTTYTYNGFDELLTSTDANQQLRTRHYDLGGRLTSLDDVQGATQWIYDQGVNALGRLSESISPPTPENPDGQHLKYTYEPTTDNTRGLLQQVDTIIDGVDYPVSLTYDDLGRTQDIKYPHFDATADPIVAHYDYDASGVLTNLTETGSSTARPIWRLDAAYQGFLPSQETFGNGAVTSMTYDSQRLWLKSIQTTLGTDAIQSLEYTRWPNGLLETLVKGGTEERSYLYDSLNRIDQVNINTSTSTVQTFDYNDLGSLTTRGDTVAGDTTTAYVAGRSHLIDHFTTPRGLNIYGYDAKGNEVDRNGPDIPGTVQQIDYTPFDLPKTVTVGTGSQKITKFEYSADEDRLVRRDPNITRVFVSGLYQRVLDNATSSATEERFQLYAGGGEIAEIVRTNGTDRTLFFHSDREGTVDTISTGTGDVFHQQFETFGNPVDPPNPELTRSGFTGQQHDTDLGLLDYGGRVYDPIAAQFTTADPIMQAPFWSQGLNRYAYAFNNPVNNVDPSGFDSYGPGDFTLDTIFPSQGAGTAGQIASAGGTFTDEAALTVGDSGEAAGSASDAGLAGGAGAAVAIFGKSVAIAKSSGNGWQGYAGAARSGHSQKGTAPSAAPASSSGTRGAQHAVAQNQGGVGPATDDQDWRNAPPLGLGSPAVGNTLSRPEFKTDQSAQMWETTFKIEMALVPVGEGGGLIELGAGGLARLGRSAKGLLGAADAAGVAEAAPTLSADVDMLAQFGPRVPTQSGGYFNVVTHADANAAYVLRGGQWTSVSHRTLAQFIERAAGYTGGPVRLIGCNAGACATGLAQNLANKLGATVLAPTGTAFVDSTGSFWTSGTWQLFSP